ncbi:MAG TPA: methylated-DNA--[protein]-cysteine S-methyltransferase [Solirubrobacterales bacterium]|nr:methylated-DNA--[protein]-cysteine S-methyltransferase [Solirubrobacterales bacterium]
MGDGNHWTIYESPLGPLTIVAGADGALRRLRFPEEEPRLDEAVRRPLETVVAQLDDYFAGERHSFDLALALTGTPLQRQVWARLREIPYGETVSYGEVTEDLDGSVFPNDLEPYKRVRAVGTEIGRTPVPIVIPCHRVLGADGSLTGYGGGLDRKRALLELESGVTQLPLG